MNKLNELAYEFIGAAIEVHKEMGPGLLESVYEECLVEELRPIHEVQVVTYLKLAKKRLGYLMNFNVTQMTKGLKRKVNNF